MRYAEHVELCRQVPNAVFRHGKVTGAPMGEPKHAYYAEWEFADEDAFKSGDAERRVHGDGQGRVQARLPAADGRVRRRS